MKSIVLSIALIFCMLSSYGQAMLGASMAEVKIKFNNPKHNMEEKYDKDLKMRFFIVDTEISTAMFYFDDNSYCVATLIFPDNQAALHTYIELQ